MTRFLRGLACLLFLYILVPTMACAQAASAPAKHAFSIRTGDFTIAYDSAQGPNAPIRILHNGHEAHLITPVGNGASLGDIDPQPLQVLHPNDVLGAGRAMLNANRDWGSLSERLETYAHVPGLIRLSLEVRFKRPTRIEDIASEFQFAGAREEPLTGSGVTLYKQQAGLEAPLIYLYHSDMDASLVYFQNLTRLNRYLDTVQGDPRYSVHVDGGAFGFHRPHGLVPADEYFTLSDTFLWLSPGRQTDEFARAKQFIQAISDIYDQLDKPYTRYTDWPFQVAPQAARDLLDPVNGLEQGGTRLLRSYVSNEQTSSECITNLDVLIAAKRYAQQFGADANLTRLIADLEKGLPLFYTPLRDGHTVSDNASPTTVTDSWYFVYPLVQTAELAQMGSEQAKTMLLGSAATMTAVAHDMHYEFPLVVDLVHGKEVNGNVRENDTLGGYAYVMLVCYKLTNEARYLDEAKQAVEHIRGKEFHFTYETHLSAVTLEALGWLYQLTNDRHYLDLSSVPLANLLALTWLWQPLYGYASEYGLFLGINPLPTADEVAAMEQHNVWWYLRRFYLRAERGLPVSSRKLLAEMIKYQITVARGELPPFLPEESLCKTPYLGTMRPVMMIPVEDLHDGFHKAGLVGQEIYGAGLAFRFAADAYQTFGTKRSFMLYAEYPVTRSNWNAKQRTLTFTLGGTSAYRSRVRLFDLRKGGQPITWRVRSQSGSAPQNQPLVEHLANYMEYALAGGQTYVATAVPGRVPPLTALPKPTEAQASLGVIADPHFKRFWFDFSTLRFHLGAIAGAGGIVQAEAGSDLTLPLVLSNFTTRSFPVTFGADLPPGWTLKPLTMDAKSGQTVHVSVSLHAPDTIAAEPVQITLSARAGIIGLESLPLMVRVIAPLPVRKGLQADFGEWETRSSGQITHENEETVFTIVDGGSALFETKAIRADLDRNPILLLNVSSQTGPWALKIHEEGDSGYGIYLSGDTTRTGLVHFNLQQMLGWSGIHTFRLQLYVLGGKGKTLHARAWGLGN